MPQHAQDWHIPQVETSVDRMMQRPPKQGKIAPANVETKGKQPFSTHHVLLQTKYHVLFKQHSPPIQFFLIGEFSRICVKLIHLTGQIITTSAEVTLNGDLVRESLQNPLNSRLGIILFCPDLRFPPRRWKFGNSRYAAYHPPGGPPPTGPGVCEDPVGDLLEPGLVGWLVGWFWWGFRGMNKNCLYRN